MCWSGEIGEFVWLVCRTWFGNVEGGTYVGGKLVGGYWVLIVGDDFGDYVVEFFVMVGDVWCCFYYFCR